MPVSLCIAAPPQVTPSKRYYQCEMCGPERKLDGRQLARISKALADPKRFEMLRRIAASTDAPTCSAVRDWLGLAPATVSHHLKELEGAGLVNVDRNGKFAYITLRREVWDAYVNRLSSLCKGCPPAPREARQRL
jgi:ArsR family transcriptional regulator, arsenate/arsenite/antimonite-responsive transcriptional repressor